MRNLKGFLVLLYIVFFVSGTSIADEDTYIIKRADGWPVIDGRLESDNIWFATSPLVINDLRQVIMAGGQRRPDVGDKEIQKYWKGFQTLSGKIYLLIEGGNLFLGADITDDNPLVNQGVNEGIANGCSIELFFGSKDRNDYPETTTSGYAPFEYRVILGLDKNGKGTIWFSSQTPSPERATNNAPASGGEISAVKKADNTGYVLEAKIPLNNFGMIPYAGISMGQKVTFDIGLNHAGTQPGPDGRIHRDVQMMWYGDVANCENSKSWRHAYLFARPGLGSEVPTTPPPKITAIINVAGDTAWEINGYRDIPKEIFGARVLSVNRGITDIKDFVALLKEAGFESFFYYIYPHNIPRDMEDPARPGYPKKELYEYPEKAWAGEEHFTGSAFDNLRLVNPDATYELCLQEGPRWMSLKPISDRHVGVPADSEEYARMASTLIRLYQTSPRGTGDKIKFVSFMNEPEPLAHWGSMEFKDDPTAPVVGFNGEKGIDCYIKTFKAVSRRLRADFPGLQFGGPVAAFPGHMLNWWCWKNWGIKFIDETGPLCDFYDYHPYADLGNDRDSILAQATMITNHVQLIQKRQMKTVLSEQNLFGSQALKNDPGQRFKQLLWNQRILSMALDNPDKIGGVYYFIVFDDRTFRDFDELQWENIWHSHKGKLEPYPVFYLYRGMRDLRGTRLYTKSSHPYISVLSAINGNRLSAVVFNDAYQEASVDLTMTLPEDTEVTRVLSSGWEYNRGWNDFSHFEDREISVKSDDGKLRIPITLSPFAAKTFVIELTRKADANRKVITREYYANRIFAEEAAETKPVFKINLPDTVRQAKSLVLRLGWDGPRPSGVIVGTVRYEVPEQMPDISDIHIAEIPLKISDISATTEVMPVYNKSYPNSNEKVLFATIVVTENGQ